MTEMALPIIKTPTYELNLPSTKKSVKYRPFVVREQKALLIAQQNADSKTMLNTLRDVIHACTFDALKGIELTSFDIEYLFTMIRARSVGETSQLTFSCLECNDPNAKIPVIIDLTGIEVVYDDNHTNNIELSDGVGMKMKYPGPELLDEIKQIDYNDLDTTFVIMAKCIDTIYDSSSVYSSKDYKQNELVDFIGSLTQDQFAKVRQFFDTMPRLEKEIEFDCPVCGYHHKHILRGMDSFF